MKEFSNPWTTVSSKKVYDNNWISIEHHEVLNPNGNPGIYGKVHFKHIAIGIIPIDQDGNSWIVGQFRYPLNQYSWEIPEGGGKIGVPYIDSAKRELLEETGITANAWEMIQTIHTSNSVCDEVGVIYLAQDLSFGPSKPEDSEQLQIRKVPIKEIFQMILDGEITDSLSVAGIFKVKEMLPEYFQ